MQPKNPAPLLIVIASYDANGNGKNDYDPNHPELLNDKTSPIFGEQWALTKPEDCYETFFGEKSYSLMNYYKEMTHGKFWFYPVHIDHKKAPDDLDGVLEVTVPMPHPAALRNLNGYDNIVAARKAIHDIVKACDPYVDFAKYDLNGDGVVTPDELAIIILNAGYDSASTKPDFEFSTVREENCPVPSHRYMVHGTSQATDVTMTGGVRIVKVSNVGEMTSFGPMPIGTPAHELAHNLGAQDMYCRFTPMEQRVFGWPLPNVFSLMSRGGSRMKNSTRPAYLDPYQRVYLGFAEEVTADEDGVYTLYSTLSGKYQVLKITTPNPDEYFLAEIRLKEGFEEALTEGDSKGGVIFWHIDERVNREWFKKAQCVSSNLPDGKRHDLGNAVLLRNMFEEIKDENGNFVKFGPYFKMDRGMCNDPFFYKSDDPETAMFDSSLYCGAASNSYSLNHFPEGVSRDWKLTAEVLDEPGAEMRIQIKRG